MSATGISNMYAVYRQTDPPTAVEFAEYCNLVSGTEKELVVCGANHIRVFRLNPYVISKKQEEGDSEARYVQTTKMECMLSFSLLAPVKSFAVGRLPGMARDCLLLGFQEAKLSVVAYDPPNHDLTTISMHCFEEEFIRGGFTRDFPDPIVRADPERRCCAMAIYGRHLAIVPFLSKSSDAIFDDFDTPQTVQAAGTNETPKFALYSYSVPLESLDERLQNVADMCFLDGYHEPTLLFLYEPSQTTTGRVAVRQDTYCILAVSLNVKDRAHAVIWNVNQLPFDCFRCVSVPKPIGGTVLFAANSVIYLNQSVPAYGVALNSCIQDSTEFPLKDQTDKELSLDCSVSDFISPNTMLLSTRLGDVYVMTMLVDNTNVVKGIQLDKSTECDIPTVARSCGDGYIFFGSRLGDSSLLRFAESDSFAVSVTSEPRTRGRTEGAIEDDLALYGEIVAVTTVENIRVIQYSFEECDKLVNFGPCRTVTMGVPVSIPEPLQSKQNLDPAVDIVFAGGHDKNGCITVLQRQVRPNILTSPLIPGALQLWTVGKTDRMVVEQEDGTSETLLNAQQYLLVTKEMMTMVLELKGDIAELESSGFIMDKRTVAAGDFCGGRYTIQVAPMEVVLIENLERVQEISLDISFPVAKASIVDPYAVLLAENGEVFFLQLVEVSPDCHRLVFRQPMIHQDSPATAVSVYRDMSGLFSLSAGRRNGQTEREAEVKVEPRKQTDFGEVLRQTAEAVSSNALTVDDEDELLYGISSKPAATFDRKPTIPVDPIYREPASKKPDIFFERMVPKTSLLDPNDVMPTFWVLIVRENGLLEIFKLPDFKLVYMVRKFPLAYKTLFDTDPLNVPGESERPDEHCPIVRELLMLGTGANNGRPHLLAVIGDELAIYEAFPFDEGYQDHLSLRFKRLMIPAILRNVKLLRGRKRHLGADQTLTADNELDAFQYLLYPFDDVSGYSGVFVAGPYPGWCMMTDSGTMRFHPMSFDGAIRSFATFHNVNCKHGFIYMTAGSDMRICQLPEDMDFGTSCPMHKQTLGTTIHSAVYLLDSHTYAVAFSEKVPCTKIVTMVGEEKQVESMDKSVQPHFIFPTMDAFKVDLYSPETLQPVPGAGELEMEEFEHITVMKEVNLKSEGTMTGYQNYLAFGTIHNFGDEVLVRGRIFICEVIEVVPEPGQPLTKHKLKTLYCKEQKGPVTSMCSANGYLLTGMGQKVYIWAYKDNDLVGISFLDLQFYIHQMTSMRNLTLVADVYESVSLLRYQESHKALSLASRDLRSMPVQARPMGIDFMIDNRQLGMLMSDEEGNLTVLSYQPEAKESLGGQRLIPRADMFIGARITGFVRIQGHVSDGVVDSKVVSRDRHLNLFGTLDGALGFVLPLPEKVYRRLHSLQAALSLHLPHLGGLNPRSARNIGGHRGKLCGANRNLLDGDVLWMYFTLSHAEKQDFARRIATSREQLLDDLLELQRVSTHF